MGEMSIYLLNSTLSMIYRLTHFRNGDMIHIANPDTKFAPGIVAGAAPT
jgi:hypothetical protein